MGARLSRDVIIKELQERLNDYDIELSLADTRKVIYAFEDTIEEAILASESGEYDSFGFNFGQFKIINVPQQSGYSALTGKEWTCGAHKKLGFKFSGNIKERLKNETMQPIKE